MGYFKINGNKELNGEVDVRGAKNIIVALLPATLLVDETIHFSNVPMISDVHKMINILRSLGANIQVVDNDILVNTTSVDTSNILASDVEKLRGSTYFMGAMLSRYNEVNIKYPGGCNLGERPLNYHFDAFKEMGYEVNYIDNINISKLNDLEKSNVDAKNSVGTTINVLLATFNSKQTVTINNAAVEFEVLEVIKFLRQIGMVVSVGKDKIIVKTKINIMKKTSFKVAFDRMEAMSYAYLGFMLGKVRLKGINILKMVKPLELLNSMGAKITIDSLSSIIIEKKELKGGIDASIGYYPNFPTDLQQPLTSALLMCDKESTIEDKIFPDRMSHIDELKKMGANIDIIDGKINIKKSELKANTVTGKDLRGTMALVLAALSAKGYSSVYGLEHLYRGYDNIYQKLKNIGADIELIEE